MEGTANVEAEDMGVRSDKSRDKPVPGLGNEGAHQERLPRADEKTVGCQREENLPVVHDLVAPQGLGRGAVEPSEDDATQGTGASYQSPRQGERSDSQPLLLFHHGVLPSVRLVGS